MGIFDFIFSNKKKTEQQHLVSEHHGELERKGIECKEKKLNEEVRDSQLTSADIEGNDDCIGKPTTKVINENEEISDYLQYLAMNCNLHLNMGNTSTAIDFMNQLFDECYGRSGHKLLQIASHSTQVVGLAFSNIALFLDFEDKDLNSVAAENAVYCLGRCIIETDNTYCAPSIFTILFKHPSLLKDKLIETHCSVSQKRVGMPIGMMLGGNPFTAPHLNEFREQATTEKRIAIMAYLLSLFYDRDSNKITIRTDLPYNLPKTNDIENFSKLVSVNIQYDYKSLIKEGRAYFYELFSACQDTLKKMI
jgi:hypothetical protein